MACASPATTPLFAAAILRVFRPPIRRVGPAGVQGLVEQGPKDEVGTTPVSEGVGEECGA